MLSTRVLILALALEAAPAGASRLARFAKHKTAYAATLLVAPGNYEVKGFLPTKNGLDVLWCRTTGPRPVPLPGFGS
jgi:hypothetical protein